MEQVHKLEASRNPRGINLLLPMLSHHRGGGEPALSAQEKGARRRVPHYKGTPLIAQLGSEHKDDEEVYVLVPA